jgi:hypothetical protein
MRGLFLPEEFVRSAFQKSFNSGAYFKTSSRVKRAYDYTCSPYAGGRRPDGDLASITTPPSTCRSDNKSEDEFDCDIFGSTRRCVGPEGGAPFWRVRCPDSESDLLCRDELSGCLKATVDGNQYTISYFEMQVARPTCRVTSGWDKRPGGEILRHFRHGRGCIDVDRFFVKAPALPKEPYKEPCS